MIEPTDSEQKERSVAVTLGEVLAGLHGMAEIPGMPDLAEMPPDGFTFQGSSSKTPVAKPDGTKMFCSAFLNDARMCCFLPIQ